MDRLYGVKIDDRGTRSRSASVARFLAPLGIAGALLLTGCSYFAPTATLIEYDPADGVGADLGDVLLRNVQVVTNEDGSRANITFTAVNGGDAVELNYSVPTAAGQVDDWIPIAPGSTLVGEKQPHLIIVDEPDAEVGGLLEVTFQAGDADSATLLVPVLDVTGRPWLEPLVP